MTACEYQALCKIPGLRGADEEATVKVELYTPVLYSTRVAYDYRKMTPAQQVGKLWNIDGCTSTPLHSPPHMRFHGLRQFFVTGSCYEHKHHVGLSHERVTNFETDLLTACENLPLSIYAWCVLPNHYHVLVRTDNIEALRHELGLLHGRTVLQLEWRGGAAR